VFLGQVLAQGFTGLPSPRLKPFPHVDEGVVPVPHDERESLFLQKAAQPATACIGGLNDGTGRFPVAHLNGRLGHGHGEVGGNGAVGGPGGDEFDDFLGKP